jgi:hypothetical protein
MTELGGDSSSGSPRGQLMGLYSLELDEPAILGPSIENDVAGVELTFRENAFHLETITNLGIPETE